MRLGQIIKSYREQHDLSMEAFADRAGLTKAYISMLENGNSARSGEFPTPSIKTFRACANAMGINVNDLLSSVETISIKEPSIISSVDRTSSDYDLNVEYYKSIMSSLPDSQLDSLLVALISDRDKDYLLQLAAKILEIASKK